MVTPPQILQFSEQKLKSPLKRVHRSIIDEAEHLVYHALVRKGTAGIDHSRININVLTNSRINELNNRNNVLIRSFANPLIPIIP